MIADRIDQPEPEPAADLPVADAPQAENSPLLAQFIELQHQVVALRARVAQLESPPRRWMALKAAARREEVQVRYETLRRWVTRGSVVARKDGGRIFVDLYSVLEYIARSRDK